MSFDLTPRQREAIRVQSSAAKNVLLEGGSRSGKTFIICRTIATRAIVAEASRHAIMRFRFNAVKAAIVHDTFPKMMKLCYPKVKYRLDKVDWFAELENDSHIWFGGLDDKDRAEKILGQEYASIFFNECSQIPYTSRNIALTRLAQQCYYEQDGERRALRLKAYYDCNPPSTAHWSYQLFHKGVDPETKRPIDKDQYVALLMNPQDNAQNLPTGYVESLASLPARMRLRFLEGKYTDITENALWNVEMIERSRVDSVPDMQRIIVAVDPSGAGDTDNMDNDAIGIVVVGLGMDGVAYVLEDITCKAGPATWGKVATNAYDRHDADLIVGETNYGGEMVGFVVRSAKPGVPFKKLTASRGKVVRAEPISSLTEQGKVKFAGQFPELEDELCAFTTAGYIGQNSPNRADSMIWGVSELFPGLTKVERKRYSPVRQVHVAPTAESWMLA